MQKAIVVAVILWGSACSPVGNEHRTDSAALTNAATVVSSSTPAAMAASSVPQFHWPADQMAYQLGNLDSLGLQVPRCGGSAVVTPDSVGALRPGRLLSEIARFCPSALTMWDLGDEGTP